MFGSVTTHSFSDDNDSVPKCYIFDTDTFNLNTYAPTACPLFRKVNVASVSELTDYISNINTNYKYVLHVTCPFEIKDEVKQVLSSSDRVIASRLSVRVSPGTAPTVQVNDTIISNIDIKQSFSNFLDETDLKYPKTIYSEILQELK